MTYWLQWVDDSGDPNYRIDKSFNNRPDFVKAAATLLVDLNADDNDMANFIADVSEESENREPTTTLNLKTGMLMFGRNIED